MFERADLARVGHGAGLVVGAKEQLRGQIYGFGSVTQELVRLVKRLDPGKQWRVDCEQCANGLSTFTLDQRRGSLLLEHGTSLERYSVGPFVEGRRLRLAWAA